MTSGLLWFDNSKDTLAVKVQKAAAYYAQKYGRKAELCLVNPAMMTGQKMDNMKDITVRPWRGVLPHHFWVGVDDGKVTA